MLRLLDAGHAPGAGETGVRRLDPDDPSAVAALRTRLLEQARSLHTLAEAGRADEALALEDLDGDGEEAGRARSPPPAERCCCFFLPAMMQRMAARS